MTGIFGEDVFTNEFDAIEMVETYETRDNETASRLVEFSRLVPFDELDYVPTGSPEDTDHRQFGRSDYYEQG